jgi:PST family polysaccharide transporter
MSIITYRTIIAKAIYTMLIFVIVKTPDEYLYIPIITSVGNLFVVIWTWLVITKNLQIKYRIVSFSNTIQAMKESSVFFLSRIASTAYGASNAFILGFICSSAALANFGAANTLISSARVMFSPIADSLYPYMVNKKNYKLVKMLLFILSPLILIGTIVLFIFAEPIVVLICGSEFSEAVPIFRAMLPIIPITLPLYLLGFPVLGAMGKMKEANMSVVYAAIFHMVGLGVLFAIGSLNFISVAILTCGSEAIVLTLRIFYVFIGKRGEECNEKSFKAICIKK